MPSTRSRGKPLTPYDPELGKTLHRMNNQGVQVAPIREGLGRGARMQPLWEVNENNQVPPNNRVGEALRPQDAQRKRLNDNGRVNINITEFNGPLILPPLPLRYTFPK